MRHYFLFVLLLFVSIFLTMGCSQGHDSEQKKNGVQHEKGHAAVSKGTDPCKLLSESDILSALPVKNLKLLSVKQEAEDVIGFKECFYDLSKDDMFFVQIMLYKTAFMKPEIKKRGDTAEAIFLMQKKFIQNPVEVQDLGEQAYYGGSGLSAFGGLHVLIDRDTALTVRVGLGKGNGDTDAHIKIEKALAQKIMSRL